ncbi:hypothetical protein [Niabella beijingensis]|uniref:hypothetical protein n=1 Tax=Niabella beijingensis TaxID=2872700 RepID=UPI001CBCF165|nr:hypothetical protein [Niabella beijingensis]MBZ4191014.1 hypothetical protein [Niabella beijingensis]
MNTKKLIIKGKTLHPAFQKTLQLKAEELDITGILKANDNTATLVTTGVKDHLEDYITWCEAAVKEQGAELIETSDLAFKAYYNFSLT